MFSTTKPTEKVQRETTAQQKTDPAEISEKPIASGAKQAKGKNDTVRASGEHETARASGEHDATRASGEQKRTQELVGSTRPQELAGRKRPNQELAVTQNLMTTRTHGLTAHTISHKFDMTFSMKSSRRQKWSGSERNLRPYQIAKMTKKLPERN